MAAQPNGRRRGLRHLTGARLAMSLVVTLALAACSSGGERSDGLQISAQRAGTIGSTTSTASSEPPTTAVPSTTTTAPPPPPGLGPGARGPVVAALEAKLASLHYDVGSVDDAYDQDTAYGVMAFQKIGGMERTGRATDDVVAAIEAAKAPPPAMVPSGGGNRVEVDLARQVLFLYEGNALTKILTVSTGSGARFCSQGYCRRAITDPGSFKVYRQARGWEHGPLGSLYNPQYFEGGIAIHGATSVPASPASHGCVRIPMHAAEWFPSHVSLGTPVYVAGTDGSIPPPLAEPGPATPDITIPAPAETPTPPVPTVPPATTTTVPSCIVLCPTTSTTRVP
jgi:lipoprotein-anchoring transpeptidase ErfK/SrfK